MSSSHVSATTSNVPGRGGQEDKAFWEEYLTKKINEDIRLITRWQMIIETLLVYVGLFIGVLTAFIMSSMFQPSPGDATNRILVAIYNHNMNASSPIDLQQYLTSDATLNSFVASRIPLLYISLAISVTEAALALIINVWLTRYQRSLTKTGPSIHERIARRHESYTGLMEWRLPSLIEILPMVALVALALFAVFISDFIWDVYPKTSDIVGATFINTALFFVLTASFAAFIPGAPFHSPLSGFIRLIIQILPNRTILGVIRIRIICVLVIFGVSVVFVNDSRLPLIVRDLLLFLSPVLFLSLCQRTQTEQKQPKPRLFSLATWLYSQFIVMVALYYGMVYLLPVSKHLSIVSFSLACIMLVVTTIVAMRMSQCTAVEGKAKAEAVAWMIKIQPSLIAFQNAFEIARKYAHLRPALLEEILPVLDALVRSIQGIREQDLNDEEKIYITLLAVLVDFEPSKASFWHNEAAVKRPVLSDELKKKLRALSKGGCTVHASPPLSGCTKGEAEYILGKVGGENSAQKDFTQAV